MKKIQCYKCPEEVDDLGYIPCFWTQVKRETGNVHDSASVTYGSEFWLCPDCGRDLLRNEYIHDNKIERE